MRKLKLILAVLLILSSVPSYAGQSGGLVLFKEPPYFANPVFGGCRGLYHVEHGSDVPDLRDSRFFSCEGRYTLTLSGPAGNVATVFGRFNFKTDYGFLIIRKTDDKLIWIIDYDGFPDRQWHTVEAKGQYGGYEVFFRAAPAFDRNISSVKWGEWWGKPENLLKDIEP